MSDPDDVLLTARQAMEILGYKSPTTIARCVEDGRLRPAQKLGGRTGAFLFWRRDIIALATSRTEVA